MKTNTTDWVNSYSPGIWQVYRVVEPFNKPRFSLKGQKRRANNVVCLKRLLDENWQPNFDRETCDPFFATPLSPADRKRVESILNEQAGLRTSFDAYLPAPLALIINLSMSVPKLSMVQSFYENTLKAELARGLPLNKILPLMEKADLAKYVGQIPLNATLQLVCRDYEAVEGELIVRDGRVLPF